MASLGANFMVLMMRKPLTALALVGGSLLLATFGGDQESDGSDDLSSDAMSKLEKLGLEVFSPEKDHDLDWSSLAGYEDLVEELRETRNLHTIKFCLPIWCSVRLSR